MNRTTICLFGVIGCPTPSSMTARVRNAMVHHVSALLRCGVHGNEVMLACGARVPRSEATETEDPVDCMACMVRQTTP